MKQKIRKDRELPDCVAAWGWQYHHLGIPTEEKKQNEIYLEKYGMFVSGFSTCPFGVEWMRFEDDSPVHELIRTKPHLAFVVSDLDHELTLRKFKVISPPGTPSAGVRVAMIDYEGIPIELMEFTPGNWESK